MSDRRTVQVSEIFQRPGGGVQGVEEPVVGGDVAAGQVVQEGGLACVGVTHDGHHRHLVLDAPIPLDSSHPADVLQVLFQLLNLPADVPTVGLQLGLAGAAGADGGFTAGGGLAHQVPPHAGQPGEQVFVLRQGHLQAAFLRPCPLGEDVQNQASPIHDLDADVLGQDPHLSR